MTERPPLPRTVWLVSWVSFFADVSSEMIYPLLPLFIVGVLGATATSMGWIEGTAQATVALLTAYAGWRSDRFRHRVPYIRWGYGLPVGGKAILVGAIAWPMVLLGRTIDRVGKGLRASPRDALMADVTPGEMRGRAFGLHRAMDTAGALVGVLIAAVMLWLLGGSPAGGAAGAGAGAASSTPTMAAWPFRVVFATSAVLGIAALALTFLLKEAPHVEKAAAGPRDGAAAPLPRSYWIVLATMLVFSVANSSDTFLLLRARHVGLEPWSIVLAYAVYNVVYALGSYPAGALSDRLGRWRMIGLGWAIYAVVYAGLARTSATTIWPLFAAYGIYMALTDGVGKALVADHAPAERRGLALGVFYLATGLTSLGASVAAGLLWDHVGPAAPFWLGAAAAVLALALVPLAARLSSRRPPR